MTSLYLSEDRATIFSARTEECLEGQMSYRQQSFLPLATAQNVPSHSSGKSMFQAFLPSRPQPSARKGGQVGNGNGRLYFWPMYYLRYSVCLRPAQSTAKQFGFLAHWKHKVSYTHTHTHKSQQPLSFLEVLPVIEKARSCSADNPVTGQEEL